MQNDNIRWLILAIGIVLLFSLQGTVPKESVADIVDKPCSVDLDCPCFGLYNGTATGYGEDYTTWGIGAGRCVDATDTTQGVCDTTYCVDMEPMGTWLRDNPWAFIRDSPIALTIALIMIVIGIWWPKRG